MGTFVVFRDAENIRVLVLTVGKSGLPRSPNDVAVLGFANT